jgi:hypothetical protein
LCAVCDCGATFFLWFALLRSFSFASMKNSMLALTS